MWFKQYEIEPSLSLFTLYLSNAVNISDGTSVTAISRFFSGKPPKNIALKTGLLTARANL
jgi:hypothetical protein